MNTQEYKCHYCGKKFFEGNLPLLLQKKHHEPGAEPYLEVLCRGCKQVNRLVYDPNAYVTK